MEQPRTPDGSAAGADERRGLPSWLWAPLLVAIAMALALLLAR